MRFKKRDCLLVGSGWKGGEESRESGTRQFQQWALGLVVWFVRDLLRSVSAVFGVLRRD